jgi:hypothetical protein
MAQDGTNCGNSNSQQCRSYHASAAGFGFTGFNTTHCPHASPVGAGPGQNISNMFCQTRATPEIGVYTNGNCDDYCNVAVQTCGLPSHAFCLSTCNYINGSHDDTYSLTSYPPMDPGTGNSLKCRRYHAYVASTSASAAMTHCPHATTGADVCGSNCNFYCDVMQGACTGSYTDYNACLTACMKFSSNGGNFTATNGNTLECRAFYAMYATTGANNSMMYCPYAQANPPQKTPCSSAATTTIGLLTVLLALASALAM